MKISSSSETTNFSGMILIINIYVDCYADDFTKCSHT